MYNNYFSNRIKISEIKSNISSRIPSGDPRQSFIDPSDSRIQRLQGFATRTLPNSQYVATSFGTNDFPITKGQLVIVTNGYNQADGSRLEISDTNYNSEFTGDIRLLDGGKTRIGQTFPPVGTMGYFAYNSIPDGWLEMLGQSVLFEKSVGFFKYEADGSVTQVTNRTDSDYEETIETEFTPLYDVLASWGLAEISPSILGWNVTIPAMQGYYIRCLNPSSSGPDADSRLWFSAPVTDTERSKLNGRYFTPGSNLSDSFGDIPVVNHRHYGNVLHRNHEYGDRDWGITNFTHFWRNTRVSATYNEGEITQTEDYDFLPYHDGYYTGTQENYRADHTAGRPSGLGRKQIVGTATQYQKKRYFPYHGWTNWNSVGWTNAFHDGYPAHGSKGYYHANGSYTVHDRGRILSSAWGDEHRRHNFGSLSWYGFHSNDMKYGRINSFIEHFHNSVWTYWRESDSFWGPFLYASFHGFDTTRYYWTWGWSWYWDSQGWSDYNNTSQSANHLQFIYPFHIKKSPQGTATGSETLNSGNDGEQTTTEGEHSHNIYNGDNGVFSRGGYENRPMSVALRLCIKY